MQFTDNPNTAWWLDHAFIKLRSIESWTYQHECKQRHELITSHTLILAVDGEALLEIDHKQIRLNSYEAIACKPGQTIGIIETNEQFLCNVFFIDIYEEGTSHDLALNAHIQIFGEEDKIKLNHDIQILCDELLIIWNSDESLCKFRSQICLQELLLKLITVYQESKPFSCLTIEEAKQYIERNYMKEITIQKMAKLVKLSPNYFADLFKKRYGQTVMEFVSDLRLQAAKQLMYKRNAKIRDIAHQVGYADEFYFSRKFKKEIGVSPTNFIKNIKKRIIAYTPNLIGQLLPLNIIPYAAPLHPKWTAFYYANYRHEIPVQLDAYRINQNWKEKLIKIHELKADLIIAPETDQQEEQQLLDKIANVLYIPKELIHWRDQFSYVANELGENQKAEQWLNLYEQQLQNINKHFSNCYNQTILLKMVKDQLYVVSGTNLIHFIYQDLQFTPVYDEIIEKDRPITLAELHTLHIDKIFILIRQDNETRQHWCNLQNNYMWQELSAIQKQQLFIISSDPWLENSAHAYLRKLDIVESLFRRSSSCLL